MKKAVLGLVIAVGMMVAAPCVHAAAPLPSNAVWYNPITAAVGTPITLNALVYNNQSVSATVTVDFTTADKTKIASVTAVVASQNAKTLSATWKMPTTSTAITGTITAAVDTNKKTVTPLLGTLGTITIVPPIAANGVSLPSFPGSKQLSAWFGPLFTKVEAFRTTEAAYFTTLRDANKKNLDLGNVNLAISHPAGYFTYLYASALVSLFANQIIFYIVVALLILLILRFIVNLVS